jgi:CheY-like chemotaxis protein
MAKNVADAVRLPRPHLPQSLLHDLAPVLIGDGPLRRELRQHAQFREARQILSIDGLQMRDRLAAVARRIGADRGRVALAATPLPEGVEHAPLVMIVDDDPNARDLLATTVRREGYRVIEATDGATALTLAHEWHPDIITLDVLMPRMDGWAVLTALKSDLELAETPIVIVTVLEDRGIAISLGAAEFLTKPIDRARLAVTIRQHVYGSGVVLVVDDEPESRQIARRHLDRLGWEFAEAEDGASALLWLSQNPRPAMILLDLLMPGMNGFTFLEETAKRAEWLNIPIVILTAMPLDAAERALLAGRTREVIAKGADDLAQALRQVLVRLPKVTESAPTA